jgi:ADP-ribose pyrophosphatase YjhB (NUDIX family)
VGALIFRAGASGRREVLLVERGGNPLKGYWSIPGGLLETGETLERAVKREVREETGLRVDVVGFFEIFERIMPDAQGRTEYHYVLVDFLCRPAGGKLKAGDDVASVAWVPKNRLSEYKITEGTRAVVERAFRARRTGA